MSRLAISLVLLCGVLLTACEPNYTTINEGNRFQHDHMDMAHQLKEQIKSEYSDEEINGFKSQLRAAYDAMSSDEQSVAKHDAKEFLRRWRE